MKKDWENVIFKLIDFKTSKTYYVGGF